MCFNKGTLIGHKVLKYVDQYKVRLRNLLAYLQSRKHTKVNDHLNNY